MISVKVNSTLSIISLFALLSTSCASAPLASNAIQLESTSTESNSNLLRDGENLLIPSDSKRSPNGYAYRVIEQGTDQSPSYRDAVRVRLRLRNLEGETIEEGERILSIAHSTPLLEEILPLMHIGETMRVWGDNRDIWEIEMIAIDDTFKAPDDIAQPAGDAKPVEGFPDVACKVIDSGSGEAISSGDAVRIHISRWEPNGAIVESSKLGRGMVYILNDQSAATDPLHTRILETLAPGAHIRLWIPAQRAHLPFDIVEDLFVVEKLPELKFPSFPEPGHAEIVDLRDGVKIAFEHKTTTEKLKDGDSIKVDMTCWNADTGDIVEASYWHAEPETMDIGSPLGIYFDIMTQLGIGDTALARIPKDTLPATVGMPLICRIRAIEKL